MVLFAACLLLNLYFTEPLYTFTIGEPKNLLALVLFVTVAVAVSSCLHLSARRQVQAARSAGMRAIGVSTAHTETELRAAGAERAVEDFEGVTWPA